MSYYFQHKAERIAYQRGYYRRNRTELLAQDRAARSVPHKIALREYFTKTNAVFFHKESRERAYLRRATPSWADLEAIRALYWQCITWNETHALEYHLIHTIPIRGRSVCGLNIASNIRIGTKSFMDVIRFDQEAASKMLMKWLRQRGLAISHEPR